MVKEVEANAEKNEVIIEGVEVGIRETESIYSAVKQAKFSPVRYLMTLIIGDDEEGILQQGQPSIISNCAKEGFRTNVGIE